MLLSEVRTARDYNRGVSAPVRWAHVSAAAVLALPRMVARWAVARPGMAWARIGLLGLLATLAVLPFDPAIIAGARWAESLVKGDFRRVLHWLEEYGQGPSVAIAAILIWQLDPARRAVLIRWLVALALAAVLLFAVKLGVGRPRPRYDDPWMFLGPFGAYPVGPGRGVWHAWEFWEPVVRDTSALWSMPSSHTAYATLLSCMLGTMYPPIRWLVVALAVVVGAGRVLNGAHYASDVLAGATIGLMAARVVAMRAGSTGRAGRGVGAGGLEGARGA